MGARLREFLSEVPPHVRGRRGGGEEGSGGEGDEICRLLQVERSPPSCSGWASVGVQGFERRETRLVMAIAAGSYRRWSEIA